MSEKNEVNGEFESIIKHRCEVGPGYNYNVWHMKIVYTGHCIGKQALEGSVPYLRTYLELCTNPVYRCRKQNIYYFYEKG